MNKLKKFNIDFIKLLLLIIIVICLPLVKLISYLLFQYNIVKNIYAINQVYILWFSIPILVLLYLYDIFIKKKRFDKFDYIMLGLIVAVIMSVIFSDSKKISLLGRISRYEGLYSLLSYFLIFLNCKNIEKKKYIKILINIFMIIGIVQVVYGILQVYGNFPFIRLYSQSHIASGLCGNPNFFGSYVILLLGISTTLYLFLNKKIYLFYTIIYFFGLCICGSLGPFLTYIIVLIFISIYFFVGKKIKLKNYIVLMGTLVLVYFCINNLPVIVKNIKENIKNNQVVETVQISEVNNNELKQNENINIDNKKIEQVVPKQDPTIFNMQNEFEYLMQNPDKIDTGRMEIWKNTLFVVKDYWLFGVGPDNLGNYYPHGSKYIDKAHNIYLHTLVTTGIFSLIFNCLLCLFVFINGFKSKNPISIALWISFIGYCIQGFVNISVIDVAPLFFMIMGLFLASERIDNIDI